MNGLVVCGGQSSRMGIDKSLLNYHGLPQRYYIYTLLQKFCDKVYISCNEEQTKNMEPNFHFLIDEKENIGPMAALLRAFKEEQTAWLVMGCDYPFFDAEELSLLIENRKSDRMATVYYNKKNTTPEPLLGIYEAGCRPLLQSAFHQKQYSLKHFLLSQEVYYIAPQDPRKILSVDTKEAYETIIPLFK